MILDVHCHYTFSRRAATAPDRFSFEPERVENPGAAVTALRPTDFDSCISPRALARPAWRLVRWWQGLPPAGPALDARLAHDFHAHLDPATGPIDRFVLLAFDAAITETGECPLLPAQGTRFGSDIYSSNSFVRASCRRFPDRFLFGASVHPYRPHAPDLIDEVFAGGACLLKWIPSHHGIAFDDPRTHAAMERCAHLGLPLLIHCGEEFTLTMQYPRGERFADLRTALRALRHRDRMPTTIIAHVGTPATPWGPRSDHRLLLEALAGEFADAPLYADISALCSFGKVAYLRTLRHRPELHHKLLFGSDFPVPPGLFRLRRELGPAYREVVANPSWPQQTAIACRRLGFQEIVMQRAAKLLPNVAAFAPAAGSKTHWGA